MRPLLKRSYWSINQFFARFSPLTSFLILLAFATSASVAIASGFDAVIPPDFAFRMVIISFATTVVVAGPVIHLCIQTIKGLDRSKNRHKALTKELDERIAQLEESNRERDQARIAAEQAARAKSDFLANMSHEIRTPMNGVIGMADLLAATSLTARQQRHVEIIRTSGKSLLAIINQILDFSKIEAGKLTLEHVPFDLPGVIQDVVDLFSEAASNKSVILSATVPENMPRAFKGDPNRLRQIFTNLVGNAIKFTEGGGSVDIRVDPAPARDGWMHVKLAVEDTGIGIEPDKRDGIFDAFAQADGSTSRKFGGTGLGLAIVGDLVSMMGGEIAVRSLPGQGSTFTVSLSLETAPEAQAETADRASAAVEETTEIRFDADVLLAEDNAVNQELAREALSSLGCRVIVAGNGREAVDAWRGGRFDLVLMDCQMPEMDGFDATALILAEERRQNAGSHTPIVALTAHVLDEDRERCFDAGMDDYLPKPFDRPALIAMLRRWLEGTIAEPADDPEASTRARPVIDQAVIDSLNTMGGSGTIVPRLAAIYISTAPQVFESLRDAVYAGDPAEVHRIACALRLSSANIGAVSFAASCKRIENLATGGALDDIRSDLPALETEFKAVQRGVDALRAA